MAQRSGSADLPLHGGRVPPWLADRMTRLGAVICQAIVLEYGREELLRRLAHPFWFQSFGAVMGMDWHSSGITTSVIGALKRGLTPLSSELGLYVCGGRGKHSRRTPDELVIVGERAGLDGAVLARTSRLVAKVDSAAHSRATASGPRSSSSSTCAEREAAARRSVRLTISPPPFPSIAAWGASTKLSRPSESQWYRRAWPRASFIPCCTTTHRPSAATMKPCR